MEVPNAPKQALDPDAQKWENEFNECLSLNPTAKRAWREICNAGIKDCSLQMLWGYAGAAAVYHVSMYDRAAETIRNIDAAIRAEQQARKHCEDPRSPLFRDRANEARVKALNSPWPIPDGAVRTLGDELRRRAPVEVTWQAVRKGLVKSAGGDTPLNEKYYLLLLKAYAGQHDVTLGAKRLVALANCANQTRSLDQGTLARYIRNYPPESKKSILRD